MLKSGNILIIEDNADIQDALMHALELQGYQVKAVDDGREAMEYLRTHPHPKVILLDLSMPVMDGWEFREEQARDPELTKIPVILISADTRLHQKASHIGAAGYLKKPIQLEILLEAVKKYCS